jgi:drug/metabolite transporter (DMT)-like permease
MSRNTREDTGAVLCLLAGAACIAFAPIFVRLSELGPSATAFYRLFFSLPVFWIWMGMEQSRNAGRDRRPATRRDFLLLALAGFYFAGDLAIWHWSIRLTSVANATLLANFAPVFVTLGSYVWFGERFSKTFLTGMACAVTGVVILMGDSFQISGRHLLGDLCGMATAVFYSAYLLTVGRLRNRFSTATIMAWSGLSASLALMPITVISGEGFIAGTIHGWLVLAGLALISQVGGQSLITYALAHLSAAFGSVGLLLQPALAAMFAWILFREDLSLYQLAGGVILLAGVYYARRGSTNF